MADLKFIGRILGVIGGILMVVFGIITIINGLEVLVVDLGIVDFNVVGTRLGSGSWLVYAIILILCGIVAVYGYQQLAGRSKGDLLVWGIIYIVVGIVGGTLGGLLTLIGGIILLIDYFL